MLDSKIKGQRQFLVFPQCFLLFQNQNLVFFFSLIDWLNGVLRRFKQYFSRITATGLCNLGLSWISPVLGWGSDVSYPRTLPWKNPEDPVRLEPRTPGLWVKYFTTEPRWTPFLFVYCHLKLLPISTQLQIFMIFKKLHLAFIKFSLQM